MKQLSEKKPVGFIFQVSLAILSALMPFEREAASGGWNVQNTVAYVPDPELEDMGQGPMAPGATVYAYVKNDSSTPMSLAGMRWEGMDVEELIAAYPHAAVWKRLNPETVLPGGVGEIALRLRRTFAETRNMTVFFSNGEIVELAVAPESPEFRIQTLAVHADRRRVFLYVERAAGNNLPETVLLDGAPIPGTVTWLSDGYVGTAGGELLRAAMVELDDELARGDWHTWTVKSRDGTASQANATLRVIPEPFGFGISGTADFARLSEAGFDALHSFHFLGMRHLDEASARGMRVMMHEHPGRFPGAVTPAHQAHPGLMGYNIFDEPDVHDDILGLRQGRPWGKRVGMKAPEMVKLTQETAAAAPRAPVFMTLNMTFFPGNYYTYGPIPDMMTTDFYPVTHARPVGDIRAAAKHTKRATAPRPFGFIYQCNREDWSSGRENDLPYGGYAGRDDILAQGFGFFRNDARVRGFGRPPSGGEVELQIAYLLGEGVKNFWGYADATECIGSHGILYTGARDLPEIWSVLKEMSATLAHVREEIGIAHPASWAAADRDDVLVRTLLAGRDRAIVVVINENYQSSREGFSFIPANYTAIEFRDLPWLKAGKAERVTSGGFTPLSLERTAGGGAWAIPALERTAIFRVSRKSCSAVSGVPPPRGQE